MPKSPKRCCGRCGIEYVRNDAVPGDLCPHCQNGPLRLPLKTREEQIAAMDSEADSLSPKRSRETFRPSPTFLPALFYLFAVLSMAGAIAGLALPELGGNLIACGLGLLLAGGCCVTAEVVRLLVPTEDRLQ